MQRARAEEIDAAGIENSARQNWMGRLYWNESQTEPGLGRGGCENGILFCIPAAAQTWSARIEGERGLHDTTALVDVLRKRVAKQIAIQYAMADQVRTA